ncbi:aspartate/glutamate racemase family protein [Paraburkholderia susongensis]|uniref:Asp/Glu/hydantoin racemase n=1 Tax=Paraburkholderia susongensis TaxID=1515439 RepID=A0A1X7L7C4_9BURK|nr:aspartate/glutamate racemase family protein [Paraburkholderia susongensis]SMG49778.1 Asp/Glu/hydantoin racemase [Paraburkholderia susongensis]
MPDILLINPNTSTDTTAMMVAIAQAEAPRGFTIRGASAQRGEPMIVTASQLEAAAEGVLENGRRHGATAQGIVISAFGDPGIGALREIVDVPVVGICEASILEAAHGGRRFGIATVTPDLVEPIDAKVHALGVGAQYTGTRLTSGDPLALAANPERLLEALAGAVAECIDADRAEAVVIGGGPLGQAAKDLARQFSVPVIAPIPAAMRLLLARLERSMQT